MSSIRLIVGKPKEGFKITELGQSEIKEFLKDSENSESLFNIFDDNDDGLILVSPSDYKQISLSFLPQEDQQYLKELLQAKNYIFIESIYNGWIQSTKDGEKLCYGLNGDEGEVLPDYFIEDGLVVSSDEDSDISDEDMQVIQFIEPKEGVEPQYSLEANHAVIYGASSFHLSDVEGNYLSAPQSLLEYLFKHIVLVRDGQPPVDNPSEDTSVSNIRVLKGIPQKGFIPTFVSKDDCATIKDKFRFRLDVPYTLKYTNEELWLFQSWRGKVVSVSLESLPDEDKSYLIDLFNSTKHLAIWECAVVTLCNQDGIGDDMKPFGSDYPNEMPIFEQGKHQVFFVTPLAIREDFDCSSRYTLHLNETTLYLRGDKDIYSAPESLLNFISQYIQLVKE